MCVLKTFLEVVKPLLIYNSTRFLKEKNINGKLENNLKKKLDRLQKCSIGRELGLEPGKKIDDLPLTGYSFYQRFYNDPHEGDFMYPLNDYFKNMTSGTMSKPKVYLTPKIFLNKVIMNAGLSIFFISTFDGEKYHFKFGDTLYLNIPGGSFISNIASKEVNKNRSSLIKVVPPDSENMTFQEKVDYFVEHYKEIDLAQMNITTLLDDIEPRIKEKVKLKSFITMDASAFELKERVKDFIGTYPKTPYCSTETIASTIPSIDPPAGFFFDWRLIYPEFIPEKYAITHEVERIDELPEIISLKDVEIGGRYQLVITPFYSELTRSVTSDILECIGFEDKLLKVETPIFRFYSRADRILSLHNFTRINETEIVMVLEASKIPFVDFTARRELDDTKEYLRLYVEFKDDVDLDETTKILHETFMATDKDYRDLTNMMEYTPIRLSILTKGTFKNFFSKKEGMSRIARIGMREDRLKLLLEA